jgi:biotin synthase
MPIEDVVKAAHEAKAAGATRFCMGAAYRGPKERQVEAIATMIREVKALGMETCATLGLLSDGQAETLADAGLDFYNHNLDCAESFYPKIVTTRRYGDRLETLARVRAAGIKVCCGGILGMGESRADRAQLMHTLATFEVHPESVPINRLVRVPGTPLSGTAALDDFEFVRTVAVARVLMPKSHVRLSAGRSDFSDELQALCFLAGANSIFFGERLLTTDNPMEREDRSLFNRLGLQGESAPAGP